MAEEFLTLMADLDNQSQLIMRGWYDKLKKSGFAGIQTPGLPFHISLATFSLDKEQDVISEMQKLSREFTTIPINISHIGVFAGGKVLFGAPDMSTPELLKLRKSISVKTKEEFGWTPHATILIDEPELICKAVPVLLESFYPFMGEITRLHFCAFWPTREIASIELKK